LIPGDFQGAPPGAININDPRDPYIIPAATGTFSPFGANRQRAFVRSQFTYNQLGQQLRDQMFPDADPRGMFFAPVITAGPGSPAGIFLNGPVAENISRRPSNSWENSEFGMRLSSLLPIGNGLQTSFIYL